MSSNNQKEKLKRLNPQHKLVSKPYFKWQANQKKFNQFTKKNKKIMIRVVLKLMSCNSSDAGSLLKIN